MLVAFVSNLGPKTLHKPQPLKFIPKNNPPKKKTERRKEKKYTRENKKKKNLRKNSNFPHKTRNFLIIPIFEIVSSSHRVAGRPLAVHFLRPGFLDR
ncbi:hypothetical protein AKJ16_DCAP15077 [Drosera capensis]